MKINQQHQKKMTKAIYLIIFGLFIWDLGFAQSQPISKSASGNAYVLKTMNTKIESVEHFFQDHLSDFQLSEGNSFQLLKTEKGPSGNFHSKFQQYYKGIKVFNAYSFVHHNQNQVQLVNETIYPQIELSTKTSIAPSQLNSLAAVYMEAPKKIDKLKLKNKQIKVREQELVVCSRHYPNFNGQYCMAYRIIAEDESLHNKREMLIEATTGQLIWSQSKICSIGVPSKVHTHYYGLQQLITDSLSPNQFSLDDPSRNIHIRQLVNDFPNSVYNTKSDWQEQSQDYNYAALDAHYCATKFYDMMLNNFVYRGIDGKGKPVSIYVYNQNEGNFVNAFWTGEFAVFGNGDCHNDALTTHSVVSHELYHGVTEFNSGLIYDSESGAINEALSDIFGKASEYLHNKSNFTWELDPAFKRTKYAMPFRIMNDPKKVEMPQNYRGEFWIDGNDVHINSSILNYWYFSLLDGNQGQNEQGEEFNVKPMPILDILKLLHQLQLNYMRPETGYLELYQLSKAAAKDLFGETSEFYLSMLEAWKAVGITDNSTNNAELYDLSVDILSPDFISCKADVIPVRVRVSNVGTEPVLKGTSFELNGTMDSRFENQSIILSKDLLPREFVELEFRKLLVDPELGFNLVYFELDFEDDEDDNNSNSVFTNVSLDVNNDVFNANVEATLLKCGQNKTIITTAISNNSCNPILKGSKVNIDFYSKGKVISSKEEILRDDIVGLSLHVISDTTELIENGDDIGAIIRMEGDPDDTNNGEVSMTQYTTHEINSSLFLNFSDNKFEDYFEATGFASNNIRRFGGENYFAVTGYLPVEYIELFPPCPVPEFMFTQDGPTLETCLDLSNYGSSTLSFDVVLYQYDGNIKYPELIPYSSMMQATWEENGKKIDQRMINQKEGIKVSYSYQLPAQIITPLNLKFVANYGESSGGAGDLNYDVVLMDNFRIVTTPVGTDNQINNADLYSYPNPVKDVLFIQNSNLIDYQYKLIGLDGKIWKEGKSSKSEQVQVGNLPSGAYQLIMRGNDGQIERRSIIKA
ncbi:MAG TPA: M4 family metallopeptidase [Saprospiraceae bacterium]|nr:M4 family metallopeptidase [Saprospiraceae bacterium]